MKVLYKVVQEQKKWDPKKVLEISKMWPTESFFGF